MRWTTWSVDDGGEREPVLHRAVEPGVDRTLIVSNISRMQSLGIVGFTQASQLNAKLRELASHPKVQGLVLDLGSVTELGAAYSAWDAAEAGTTQQGAGVRERAVVRLPPGGNGWCVARGVPGGASGIPRQDPGGAGDLHGVKYLGAVGDDRVIPFARIPDRTGPASGECGTRRVSDLSGTATTVGRRWRELLPVGRRDRVDGRCCWTIFRRR